MTNSDNARVASVLLQGTEHCNYIHDGHELPCSDTKVSADRVSCLFGATTSDVLETPVPIELDVLLLLWRMLNNDQLKKKTCLTVKKPTKSGEGWIFKTERYMIT